MEKQTKPKSMRSFKYNRAERVGRKVYYNKTCLHCNSRFESIRMDAAFAVTDVQRLHVGDAEIILIFSIHTLTKGYV